MEGGERTGEDEHAASDPDSGETGRDVMSPALAHDAPAPSPEPWEWVGGYHRDAEGEWHYPTGVALGKGAHLHAATLDLFATHLSTAEREAQADGMEMASQQMHIQWVKDWLFELAAAHRIGPTK